MRKIIPLLIFSVLLLQVASAYYYYAPDNYDSYSYRSERSSTYGGTKTTDYNKLTTNSYLPDGTHVKTTSYIKTTANSPHGYYGNNYYANPYSYRPWYQKYWQPTSWPRTYHQYNYYPRYS